MTLEHTQRHRVLCQSLPDHCHAVDVDPTQCKHNIFLASKKLYTVPYIPYKGRNPLGELVGN